MILFVILRSSTLTRGQCDNSNITFNDYCCCRSAQLFTSCQWPVNVRCKLLFLDDNH